MTGENQHRRGSVEENGKRDPGVLSVGEAESTRSEGQNDELRE